MTAPARFVLVLHGHIPDVLGHGVWPHGANWLYEAAAESYLPFLRAVEHLLADGVPLRATVGLTPVLCEQLEDPRFAEGFTTYLAQRSDAAEKDGAWLREQGDAYAASIADYWRDLYGSLLEDFGKRGGRIVPSFRALADLRVLEPLGGAATHGLLPLLPNDRAIERQLDVGLRVHERHFGKRPSGFWLPECAYRPGGPWPSPVDGHVEERAGLEEFLAAFGVRYFFVETHLVASGDHIPAYGGRAAGAPNGTAPWRPHVLRTRAGREVAVFARDPRSSEQVWSGRVGYPGDGRYLEFHKRRAPGGHRYWRVTDPRLDLAAKEPWEAGRAAEAVEEHAAHFVRMLGEIPPLEDGSPPTAVAMFDFELFGHWWHEGVDFLRAVFGTLAESRDVVALTAGEALAAAGPPHGATLPAGTWGRGGDFRVWWNGQTISYWCEVDDIEKQMERFEARKDGIDPALYAALERATLLVHSSDWPFLIDNEVSKDYALGRIAEHVADFWTLAQLADEGLPAEGDTAASTIREKDRLFEEELRRR